MKGALNAGFGSSMITEKLKDGIDIEVFADLGTVFNSIVSSFSQGMIMIMLMTFLINSFFTGGMFNSLKGSADKFSSSEFFRVSSDRFFSFFLISLIFNLIIVLSAILIFVIPLTLAIQSENISEANTFKTGIVLGSLFFLVLIIILISADYARAWQVVNDNGCFKAIGFGLRQTFRTFSSSFPLMLTVLAVQVFFGWVVLQIIPAFRPGTGAGIILLFLLSQSLFFIRLLLKTWRYGSVTAMMERNSPKIQPLPPKNVGLPQ